MPETENINWEKVGAITGIFGILLTLITFLLPETGPSRKIVAIIGIVVILIGLVILFRVVTRLRALYAWLRARLPGWAGAFSIKARAIYDRLRGPLRVIARVAIGLAILLLASGLLWIGYSLGRSTPDESEPSTSTPLTALTAQAESVSLSATRSAKLASMLQYRDNDLLVARATTTALADSSDRIKATSAALRVGLNAARATMTAQADLLDLQQATLTALTDATSVPVPTSTATATLPANTPTPSASTTPTPFPVPPGYQVFDAFDAEGPLDDRWNSSGDLDTCNMRQYEGYLQISCLGIADETVLWHYSPRADNFRVARGVAMAAQVNNPRNVNEEWGRLSLMIQLNEGDSGDHIRSYHISLRGTTAKVVELYPKEPGREVLMASLVFLQPQMHVVRIEFESGQLAFFINGKPIDLRTQPNLPPNPTWRVWLFEGLISGRPDADILELDAHIDWIAVKE